MSCYEHFTRGQDATRDNHLAKIGQSIDLMYAMDSDPALAAIALLMLDEAYGLSSEGSYVLIHPSMFVWALYSVEFLDPAMTKAVEDSAAEDGDSESFYEALSATAHEVKLVSDYRQQMPAEVCDRVFSIRCMTEAECEGFDTPMVTVDSNGDEITLPRSRRH